MTFQEILETRPNASKARLPALYADFRPLKDNNPDGYEANVQVWQSALSSAVEDGVLSNNDNNLVLDVTSQLLTDVSLPPWGRPLGLGSVVTEAVSRREWIPLDRFLNETVSIYEESWSVTGAIGWIWKKLIEYSSSGDDDPLPAGRFVLRRNLEDAANRILKRAKDVTSPYVDYIYSPETFAKTFSALFPRPLSKLDQLILLRYLSRDKKEIACSPNTIKFRSSNKLTPITTSDTAIAHLKTVQTSLNEQISLLTSQIATFTQKARDATSKQDRIVAFSALKSRKLSESALQKRSDALARIEEVLNGVAQAASDAEVIKSLEGGASALERLNKDIGGIERVEKVMDRVREGIEESENVGRVIAEMGSSRVDEDEVQDEFDAMLKAEEEKERKLREESERAKREMEQEERARKEAEEQARKEKENKAIKDAAKQDGLVEELKSVSLNPSPGETESKLLEEPIPS